MKRGWFLLGGVLVLIDVLFIIWSLIDGLSIFRVSSNLTEYVFYSISILFLIMFIILGVYFLRVGVKKLEQSRLLNAGLIISLIGFAFVIISVIFSFYLCTHNPSGQIGCLLPLLLGFWLFSVFNFIALILTAIHYFKNR